MLFLLKELIRNGAELEELREEAKECEAGSPCLIKMKSSEETMENTVPDGEDTIYNPSDAITDSENLKDNIQKPIITNLLKASKDKERNNLTTSSLTLKSKITQLTDCLNMNLLILALILTTTLIQGAELSQEEIDFLVNYQLQSMIKVLDEKKYELKQLNDELEILQTRLQNQMTNVPDGGSSDQKVEKIPLESAIRKVASSSVEISQDGQAQLNQAQQILMEIVNKKMAIQSKQKELEGFEKHVAVAREVYREELLHPK